MVIIPSSRARLQTALFFIANHLYINDDETNVDYNQMCERSAIKLLKSTAKTVGILMPSVLISATFPMIMTISRHQIQLIVPVLVPFTDLDTWHGLCINLLNQFITIFFGICAGLGIEIIICMLKNSFWRMSAAVCHSLDELMRSFHDLDATKNRIVACHFWNVVLQLRDRDRYALEMNDLCYWKLFIQPLMLNLSIAFSLFFYLHVSFPLLMLKTQRALIWF